MAGLSTRLQLHCNVFRVNDFQLRASTPTYGWYKRCLPNMIARLSASERSGCQTSKISTNRVPVPSCQISCSNESSKMITLFSTQVRVSRPTRMEHPGGTFNPRWHRSRALFGPQCGVICVPPVTAAQETSPALSTPGIRAMAAVVTGAKSHAASFRTPSEYRRCEVQDPAFASPRSSS